MDLSEVRHLALKCGKPYQLPDMKGGIPIIPVSGGGGQFLLGHLVA